MATSVRWKMSIKVRNDLFALSQMYASPYMQFYSVRSENGDWRGTDLNQERPLFCVTVAPKRLAPIIARVVPASEVVPDRRDMPRLMIKPILNFEGGHPFKGGNLIDIDDDGGTVDARIIRSDLAVGTDDAVIRAYELTDMWVRHQEITDRLVNYFDHGVNWDTHKDAVFPGLNAV